MADTYDSGYSDFWSQYTSGNSDVLDLIQQQLNSVTINSNQIADGALLERHFSDLSVSNAAIQNGAISNLKFDRASGDKIQIIDGDIVSVNASKLNAGEIDTSKVTIQGDNGHLRMVGNRIQVFDDQSTPIERVSIGDVDADGSVYGLRVRGADGKTILYDENGVYSEGITNGAITNPKIGDDAVDGRVIAAKSVTADHMVVTDLSAISANLGTVTAGTLTGVTINGSTFNATYKGGIDTPYGSTSLDGNSLHFNENNKSTYSTNTDITISGIDYDYQQGGDGYIKYHIDENGIVYDGSGNNMFGGFHLTVDRVSGNVSFASTQGPMAIDTKGGSVTSNNFTADSGGYDIKYPVTTGGWARGVTILNRSGGRIGGVGMLGSGTTPTYMYIGNGASPWDGNNGLTITQDGNIHMSDGLYVTDQIWRGSSGIDTNGYVVTNAIDHNGAGSNLYVRTMSGGMVIASVKGTTDSYVPVKASSFPTGSLADYKQDITPWTETEAIDLIKNAVLYKYKLKVDIAAGIDFVRHGFVIGDGYNTPQMVIDPEGDAVEQYAMNSLSIKAIQEIIARVETLEAKVGA